MPDESIKPPTASNNSFSLVIDYYGSKIRLKFSGSCLKQPNTLTYTHRAIVNIYIVYELGTCGSFDDDSTLKNALFGAVRLTKNADIDKYHFSGYGIGFDKRSSFSFSGGGFVQNVIMFGADMNSSVLLIIREKNILIHGWGSTQGLGEHSLTA